ncbi:unknown [Clostridium sp. CAG:277]|nr:unknown [Clostridium sp. CAG:277]
MERETLLRIIRVSPAASASATEGTKSTARELVMVEGNNRNENVIPVSTP